MLTNDVRCPEHLNPISSANFSDGEARQIEALRTMNMVDLVILVVVGLLAVGGLRRGFLFGIIDLIALGLSIVVAARLARVVAEPLRERGIPEELA